MATLQRYHCRDNIDDIQQALLADGCVIVEDLIDSAGLTALNADFDPLLAASDPAHQHLNPVLDIFFGQRTRHVSGVAGKSTEFVDRVLLHPLYTALCDNILLPNCADYLLNLAHIMDRGNGAEQQMFHRDEDIWIHMPAERPELELASIIAMVDFDRDNGATVVVPGSHRWPRERQPQPEDLAYAEMPAGSAVIYLGSTIHAGGSNSVENFWRRGIHLSYCLGWLRTEENNLLSVPPAQAKTLPRRAQQLLGYGIHDAIEDMGGFLGMVELQDPCELLEKDLL